MVVPGVWVWYGYGWKRGDVSVRVRGMWHLGDGTVQRPHLPAPDPVSKRREWRLDTSGQHRRVVVMLVNTAVR